jgi:hypothetical protein
VIKDLQARTMRFFTKENRLRNVTCINAAAKKNGNIIIAVGDSTPSNEDRPVCVEEVI